MKKMAAVVRREDKSRTPAAGPAGPRSAGKMKRSRMRVEMACGGVGSGGQIRTDDLRGMNPTSYCCSTPRNHLGGPLGCLATTAAPHMMFGDEVVVL